MWWNFLTFSDVMQCIVIIIMQYMAVAYYMYMEDTSISRMDIQLKLGGERQKQTQGT